ncbi:MULTISPECIES: ABC transporter permease [unclassified Micromonospora]|uniref:ABC transporter permease n=1 Tax=unclassified Micromonospora TaxID=2617518 RepID=UPI0003EEDB9C|nr:MULTISPECIES: ABC transporter permease [unclassified Micromonospora]EWM64789.1 oligopeptide/dipeptide ABC transporter permease [Micromonospora sp. M42]MCK1804583.1 ABC transporter permease [Micromonospora sp. R42106]MCK1830841.1 ABC transporter permease [Micromonospora sp. R42003]MCK1843140.1 ABC transporter permease [Micromonospora sp. R42004]MCM1015134.1 ABC transporter permease [Micromonospora sp. XM-20-01]
MAELRAAVSGDSAQTPVVVAGGDRDSRFARRMIIVGATILSVVALVAVFAPLLSPWGETEIDQANTLVAPGGNHLLGTDGNGMDIWSRVLYAARLDLGIALAAVALAVVVGTLLGLVAGYFGGWLDDVLMRVVDIFQSFPTFILALAVAALLGNGTINLIITIAAVNAPAYARLVRAEVRSLRELPFVDAAITSGASPVGVLWRHLLPNSLTPVRVIAPLNCGWAMLTLAGLSFLGLGVSIPEAEWGAMISLGAADVVGGRWWTSVPPGLALFVCVLGFSLLGEGLQDRANAKRR